MRHSFAQTVMFGASGVGVCVSPASPMVVKSSVKITDSCQAGIMVLMP